MAKKKISAARTKSSKNSKFDLTAVAPMRLKKGVSLRDHDPAEFYRDSRQVKAALTEALFDGDSEAFLEILSAFLRVFSRDAIAKDTGIPRATVFRMFDEDKKPSFDTVVKVVGLLKKVS